MSRNHGRETAIDVATGRKLMRINARFHRQAEANLLIACADQRRFDCSRIQRDLERVVIGSSHFVCPTRAAR